MRITKIFVQLVAIVAVIAAGYVIIQISHATPLQPVSATTPIIALAGDIACGPGDKKWNAGKGTSTGCGHWQTGNLIQSVKPTAVFALGDTQYQTGKYDSYLKSYDTSWGKFKSITYPVIGNHEYGTPGAAGYFQYFGDRATPQQPGCRSNCKAYYSFNIGSWHFIALNSECNDVPGGCAAGSPQEKWLKADLAANPVKCVAAMWHEPYWAPSKGQTTGLVLPLVKDLYAAHADLILNGHDHDYVRYRRMNPAGEVDNVHGIREYIVGSGGADFTGIGSSAPNVASMQNDTFGIMTLTLHPTAYDWKFIPVAGKTFTDGGTTSCL